MSMQQQSLFKPETDCRYIQTEKYVTCCKNGKEQRISERVCMNRQRIVKYCPLRCQNRTY